MEHALICPQCKAPLTPHRFARQVVCAYCGTTVQLDESFVSTVNFHEAYQLWNAPASYAFASTTSIGERHWAVEQLIATGEASDVYSGRLARWPTELVLLKVLRDEGDIKLFNNEWRTLELLQKSQARGAEFFSRQVPRPIMQGKATSGAFAGRWVSVFQWASGFLHTFEDVKKAYPQGIPARTSIWVWRRILEVLSFIHASGAAHGAVLPDNFLVQRNEHGVRLVGYGHAGLLTDPLTMVQDRFVEYYPDFARSLPKLSAALDIVMSSRCVISLLGGDPASAELPPEVPAKLADLIKKISLASRNEIANLDAWRLHEELGSVSAQVFGPPVFNPIVMPE